MKKRYPCLIAHDGHPGLHATFVTPETNLLEDYAVDEIRLPNGDVIENMYSKSFRAALHTHVFDAGSDEEAAYLAARRARELEA